jgi:hypothetical protein
MPKPKEIDFGFTHVDEKTWDLNILPEVMDIKELEQNLDIAYLDKEGTDDWNLTLRELINDPEKQPGHYDKIQKADMKYPIKIYFFGGSWKILDGVHRLCKAVIEGRKTISVCKVPPEMIPKILKEVT